MEEDTFLKLSEELKKLLLSKKTQELRRLLIKERPEDIAEVFPRLEPEQQLELFSLIEDKDAGTVLYELDEGIREKLINQLPEERVVQIIKLMPPDEATDLLEELPEEEIFRILKVLPEEEAKELEILLTYPADTAGGIMTTDVIKVNEENTIEETIDYLRENADVESVVYIYVVDRQNKLLGTVDLRKLVITNPQMKIKGIIEEDIVSVTAYTPQEEVASLAAKYDLMAIPVVNQRGRLLGRVTIDDIMDVMAEEVNEDVFKMAATRDEELANLSPFSKAKIRLPWLITCLVGTLASAWIIHSFQVTLSKVIVLAMFIPAIMGMGGNTALQSLAITIRGMTTGVIDRYQLSKVIWREISTALILGLFLGGLVGIIAGVWLSRVSLGFIVGISMTLAVTLSTMNGIFVPLFFRRIGIDPALASGPLLTTINDVVGLSVYFGLSTLLFYVFGL
ncbi:MAG TPA: magnesium transporter [Candidatus Omnitrophica bacterium]|nr:magnesium transporter [Candidatus Omnitrophota bacterium]